MKAFKVTMEVEVTVFAEDERIAMMEAEDGPAAWEEYENELTWFSLSARPADEEDEEEDDNKCDDCCPVKGCEVCGPCPEHDSE